MSCSDVSVALLAQIVIFLMPELILPTCQDGPEIKSFVEEDLETLYARTEYKFVCKPGVGPVALFKDQEGELVETMQLEGMKRSELNQLMISKGIPLASSHTEL